MTQGTENMERTGKVRRNRTQGQEDRRDFIAAQELRRQERRGKRRGAELNRRRNEKREDARLDDTDAE